MELAHPPALQRVRAFKASPGRRTVLAACAVALYACVLPQCYLTAGDPRRTAIAQLEAIDAAKPPEAKAAEVWVGGKLTAGTAGTAVGGEAGASEAEASGSPAGGLDAAPPAFYVEEETDEFGSEIGASLRAKAAAAAQAKADGGAAGASSSGEATAAKPAKEDWRKAFEGAKVETEIKGEDGRSLPSPWLPSALSCAALFLSLTGTALFFLLCHWLVWFKAWALYEPVKDFEHVDPQNSAFLVIEPVKHRGKAAIVPVQRDARGGLGVAFQRQRYNLVAAGTRNFKEARAAGKINEANGGCSQENGGIVLVTCPVDRAVGSYVNSEGLSSPAAVAAKLDLYGKNVVRIPTPKMADLLKQQLMSPLAMFQFFCAILWMLDEYWQYTIFTIFSIVMLEATTVFQRLKTFSTLGGMANKPSPLMVYRSGRWVRLTTEDLLPGDLISLTRDKQAAQAPSPQAAQAQAQQASRDKKAKANSDELAAAPAAGAPPPAAGAPPRPPRQAMDDVVPCDLLLLRGSAVVNEASLTGESVPQMKDALKYEGGDEEEEMRPLDLEGRDRVHTLYSGTNLVALTPGNAAAPEAPGSGNASQAGGGKAMSSLTTPDGGCLCYVLRTGFSSSQGELMQMIEFSTQQVSADSKETGLALLVLLCFALASSGYVLKTGLEKGDRTTHELLLKCVIIITSVVPRQLPVQMAMAVNTALMALMKAGIFCTEPFRVPFAGKISHCLFDKTGTLTTDQLVPVGVVNHFTTQASSAPKAPPRVQVHDAAPPAALVLGCCHALVQVASNQVANARPEVVGDPIELAALKGVEWQYDHASNEAAPGNPAPTLAALTGLREERAKLENKDPNYAKLSKRLEALEALLKAQTGRAARSPVASATIQARHHFSSELQRMSVVANVRTKAANSSTLPPGRYCLVKGSPEAVGALLSAKIGSGAKPGWYEASYKQLAEEGMRVLALAYRHVDDEAYAQAKAEAKGGRPEESRKWVESELTFAGFIAFTCKTRADSGTVIQALIESAHGVAMLTGDAPLTALKVAQEIGLASSKGPPLTLRPCAAPDGGGFEWAGILARHSAGGAEEVKPIPLQVPGLRKLAEKHDLVVLECDLDAASAAFLDSDKGQKLLALRLGKNGLTRSSGSSASKLDELPCLEGDVFSEVDAIKVFSRCSPQGKAKVIRALQRNDPENHVLMCGDGGNDVGALKQADVGLALLSGYGNLNTTTSDEKDAPTEKQPAEGALALSEGEKKSAETALNEQSKKLAAISAEKLKLRKTLLAQKQKELMGRQQEFITEELKAMGDRGEDVGFMGTMTAMKNVTMRIKREMDLEAANLNRKHGMVFDPNDDSGGSSSDPMQGLEDAALPIVRPGDASVAAPFTSRTPSVRSVVTLIRQGRCTLLSALQQQQIMMLECIISAYALSALSLEGARSSERQMMASGWLLMTASLAFSYTKHVDEMHPVRPLRRLFHPAVFLSMLGQAAIHVFCMGYGVRLAKETMGPDALKAVLDFHKAAKAKELPEQQNSDEDPWAEIKTMWMTPFKPNLLNTVVFLVETSQMISVLFVNYKGRPWMKGILENHPLFLSVFLCVAGVAGCAWGVRPEINDLIHLEAFPDDDFRWKVMGLVSLSLVGTFVWDRLITAIFAPEIWATMVSEAKKTTLKDVTPVLMTAVKVAGGFFLLAQGNLLLIGGLAWMYYKNKPKEGENK